MEFHILIYCLLAVLYFCSDQASSFPAKEEKSAVKEKIVELDQETQPPFIDKETQPPFIDKETQPPFIGGPDSQTEHDATTLKAFIADYEFESQELHPKKQPNMNVHVTKYTANRGIAEEIVSTEHIHIHRVRRFHYDVDYPFYYENEFFYDYEDYLNLQEDQSLLEWMNAQAEEYVVVGTVGFLVVLVTCFCCACACKELRIAICHHCCGFCDKLQGRDPKYREYVHYCQRLSLPKPTYSEFKMTTGLGAQKRSFGEKWFG